MASSSSPTAAMEEGEFPNWTELPPELTSSILHRLGAIEILETAQKVCRSWRRVCKDPSMWLIIDDMSEFVDFEDMYNDKLCRHAVDLSHGELVEINICRFATDSLLRSSNLRSLKLAHCYAITSKGLIAATAKLPLLEELEVSNCSVLEHSLKVIGQSCPNLKTLKKNCEGYKDPYWREDVALAIAETMPGLRHLQLFGDRLTDAGLNAILDGCPNLEHLDLRQCFNVNLVGDLEKRCFESIKVVRRPNDSVHDYPYDLPLSEDDLSDASDYSDFDPYDYY